MRGKTSTKTEAGSPVDSTGLPVLKFEAVLSGRCPICYQPAEVTTHKKNGYYLRCTNCASMLFTRSPAGSITFRAQQEVFANPEICSALAEMTASHFGFFLEKMMKDSAA